MNSWFPFSRGIMMAGLALAALPLAEAKIERVVEKTFTVASDGILKIETSGGNVRVRSEPGATSVKIVATKRFDTDSETTADELEKGIVLTFDQSGSSVTAKAKYERSAKSWWSFNKRNDARIDFVAFVPAEFSAEIKTSGGNIQIGDLGGRVEVDTSGGNVEIGKVKGPLDCHTSGGNITVSEALAGTKLETSGGNIRVGRVIGTADVSTSGGNISVEHVEGKLSAKTSGGNVRASFAGNFTGDCVLDTSGGNVEAKVDSKAAFQLDAHTHGGKVRMEGIQVLVSNATEKNRLRGSVNGGGPKLELRSSGGDLTIKGL
ncbi:MAG: DUF4097 family beta strand repeat-containing protein [Nibricoccus sp.]